MPTVKLTKSAIDTLPVLSKDTVYWDAGLPGFGVKVTPKGKKVFLAVHRQENIVYFKRLKPEGFALLRALQQGQPLSQAIETSVNWSGKKLERVMEQLHDWFANWSQLGWFCRLPEKESQQ